MRVLEDSKGRFLLCGVIKEISDGKGKAAGRCINVRIENKEWNSDAGAEVCNLYEVTFWDSEKLKLKSRFEKAKFEVGSFISVLFYKNEGEDYKGNVIDFKKTGLWELGEKSCVLIGICVRTNVFGEGSDKTTVATVPYNAWDRYRTCILWFFRPTLRPHKLPKQVMMPMGFEPYIMTLKVSYPNH